MAAQIITTSEVRDVLENSEFGDDWLILPESLDRNLYRSIMKIVEAAGGKWVRKNRRHEFSNGGLERLRTAMDAGNIENHQQKFQEFWTPVSIADTLCTDVFDRHRVLEPSAGSGNIARAAACCGAVVVCIEIQPNLVDLLREDSRLTVRSAADFLETPPCSMLPFDFVLMNPPFTKNQEFFHVQHAFQFLKPGGILRSIMSTAICYRESWFREWLEDQSIIHRWDITHLPSGTFKNSGTQVATVVLEIQKRFEV